jgi:hypothetical protein
MELRQLWSSKTEDPAKVWSVCTSYSSSHKSYIFLIHSSTVCHLALSHYLHRTSCFPGHVFMSPKVASSHIPLNMWHFFGISWK